MCSDPTAWKLVGAPSPLHGIDTFLNPKLEDVTVPTKFNSLLWLLITQFLPLIYRQKNLSVNVFAQMGVSGLHLKGGYQSCSYL